MMKTILIPALIVLVLMTTTAVAEEETDFATIEDRSLEAVAGSLITLLRRIGVILLTLTLLEHALHEISGGSSSAQERAIREARLKGCVLGSVMLITAPSMVEEVLAGA